MRSLPPPPREEDRPPRAEADSPNVSTSSASTAARRPRTRPAAFRSATKETQPSTTSPTGSRPGGSRRRSSRGGSKATGRSAKSSSVSGETAVQQSRYTLLALNFSWKTPSRCPRASASWPSPFSTDCWRGPISQLSTVMSFPEVPLSITLKMLGESPAASTPLMSWKFPWCWFWRSEDRFPPRCQKASSMAKPAVFRMSKNCALTRITLFMAGPLKKLTLRNCCSQRAAMLCSQPA
mmetsp:Transcript_7954/g.12061  ORF Transcript_7954/g.12061 Transcript_7954/m.12061 type:complete len:237 (-) Transcript_7954:957-1667(-)